MVISSVSGSNSGIIAMGKNIQANDLNKLQKADIEVKAGTEDEKIEETGRPKIFQSLSGLTQDSKLAMGTAFVTLSDNLSLSMSSKNYNLLNSNLLSMFNFVSELTAANSQDQYNKLLGNDGDNDLKIEIVANQIADSAIGAARSSSTDEQKQLDKLKELRKATYDGIAEAIHLFSGNISEQTKKTSIMALKKIDAEINKLESLSVDVNA